MNGRVLSFKPSSTESRGELDEALRIRKEEELPVFERLGDVRARSRLTQAPASMARTRGRSAYPTLASTALP